MGITLQKQASFYFFLIVSIANKVIMMGLKCLYVFLVLGTKDSHGAALLVRAVKSLLFFDPNAWQPHLHT